MSLDLSEKSSDKKANQDSDTSAKTASVTSSQDAANQEPVFESNPTSRYGWLKYPLILLALGLIFTALVLDNPEPNSDAKNAPTAGQGLLAQSEPGAGGDARSWLANWKKTADTKNTEAVFQQAKTFAAGGKKADAYLLNFYAARNGHGSAAMVLGEQSDPKTFSEKDSLTGFPEPFVAYKWYKLAATTGTHEAENRLSDLKTWLQKAAGKGDDNASRLLLQWR